MAAPAGEDRATRLRAAGPGDAGRIATLHADSWRRHFRGAFSDSFLDGDVVTDRRAVWSSRLAAGSHAATVLAENDTGLVGFVHVIFDDDERWGSLLDNLHVTSDRKRTGVGSALLICAAQAVAERATSRSMYLWVLEQNTPAQRFYQAHGGECVEKVPAAPPGGIPSRLTGSPKRFRIAWPDSRSLIDNTSR